MALTCSEPAFEPVAVARDALLPDDVAAGLACVRLAGVALVGPVGAFVDEAAAAFVELRCVVGLAAVAAGALDAELVVAFAGVRPAGAGVADALAAVGEAVALVFAGALGVTAVSGFVAAGRVLVGVLALGSAVFARVVLVPVLVLSWFAMSAHSLL
jgi:hypothetical protein